MGIGRSKAKLKRAAPLAVACQIAVRGASSENAWARAILQDKHTQASTSAQFGLGRTFEDLISDPTSGKVHPLREKDVNCDFLLLDCYKGRLSTDIYTLNNRRLNVLRQYAEKSGKHVRVRVR
jgi:hypothetical protein